MNTLGKFKFHFLMILGQIGCAFSYFFTNASFQHGMGPGVYTTYRLAIGGCVLLPFAYFRESERRPRLTAGLFCQICLLSFLGTSLPIIAFAEGMWCTSPTVAAAVNNAIPCIVFALAVLLRMETLNMRSQRGVAKVAGSMLSLAGVTIMTLYKGQEVSKFKGAPYHMEERKIHGDWIKGSILVVISCLSLSASYILQSKVLKKYPAKVSLAVWMNIIGGAMSAIFTGATTFQEPKAWSLGFDVRLWSILYGGIFASGFLNFVQLWCSKEKGPVFMTIFNPLTTLVSAFIAYFLVGSELHVGSIVGAAVVVVGLYFLLWGKHGDQNGSIVSAEEDQQAGCVAISEPHQGIKEAHVWPLPAEDVEIDMSFVFQK